MKRFWLFGLFLAGTLVALNAPAFAKESTDSQDSQDMADAMDDVNSALGSMASRVTTIEDQLKLKLYGDVRLRFAFLGQSQSEVVTPANTIQAQELARFRARFGAMKQFGDFNAAFRLATGSDNNPLSENQTMTSEFATKWIGVDQAYITYVPGFLNGHLKATAGKMPNPLTTTPISWDPDPQPEGALLEGSMDDAKLRATYFILNDSSGIKYPAGTNTDLFLAWFQAEQNFKIDADTSALFTVGYEYVPYVTALNGGAAALAPGAPAPGAGALKTVTALGMVAKPNGTIPDIETLEFLLNIKNKFGAIPFKWAFHFMDNLDSFDLSPGYTNQYGAWASVTAGDASDKDGLSAMLAGGYVEPNATLSLLADDDQGDTNTEFLKANLTYGIEKGLQLSWTNWAINHIYYAGASAFATATTGAGLNNSLNGSSHAAEIKSFLDLLATF